MKIIFLFFFLVGNFLLLGYKPSEEIISKIFDPPDNATVKKLKANGFERELGVDVTLLTKQINDSTRIEYFVRDSNNKIISKKWKITCKRKLSSDELEDFVKSNNGIIITSICDQFPENRLDFFVENMSGAGYYFRCLHFYGRNDNIFIEILYRYPEYTNF